MEALLEFLKNNYIYFVFVAVILIFALIGYIVDSSKSGKRKEKTDKDVEAFMQNIPPIESAKMSETLNKTAKIEPVSENSEPGIKLSQNK